MVAEVLGEGIITDLPRSSALQLIYPTDCFDGYPREYMSFVESFVSKLENFLKTKRFKIDLGAAFMNAGGSNRKTLQEYLATVNSN